MNKTNKEVVGLLIEYFLTQDARIVARLCANMLIDFNRIQKIDSLESEERESLLNRIELNSETVTKFAMNGPDGDLELTDITLSKHE